METYSIVTARHHVGDESYRSYVLVEGYVERGILFGGYDSTRQMCGFLNAVWGLVRAERTGEELDYTEGFLVQWLQSFDRYEVSELLEFLPEHGESVGFLITFAHKYADGALTD